MSLKDTIDKLNKAYGINTINKLKDMDSTSVVFNSSGSLSIDIALGGGYPEGRIIEIYGPESSGKTTLTLHAISEAQKNKKNVAFIDVEHAFDPAYAEALGIDVGEMFFAQPDSAEQALQIVDALVSSKEMSLIVIDSVAALVPKSEVDGDMGDSSIGKIAKLMAQAMRKLAAPAYSNKCTLIFINQLREKIGVMFGSPEVTTGGNSLKFYASQRIDIRKSGTAIKDAEGNLTSNQVKVKVVKNKVAPPFKVADLIIEYGRGFVRSKDVFEQALKLGLLERSGAWYSDATGSKLGKGESAALQFLEDNEEYCLELESAIREQLLKK